MLLHSYSFKDKYEYPYASYDVTTIKSLKLDDVEIPDINRTNAFKIALKPCEQIVRVRQDDWISIDVLVSIE